jgi:hypothetical protein
MSKNHSTELKVRYKDADYKIKHLSRKLDNLRRSYKYSEQQYEKDRILKEANRIKDETAQLKEYQIKIDSALKDWFNMTQSELDELLGDR